MSDLEIREAGANDRDELFALYSNWRGPLTGWPLVRRAARSATVRTLAV